jgi:hypothetical protein
VNTIDNFLIEKLTLNDESKTKGVFRSRRRNRIDSSSERKDYLKFMEFFEALGDMPGLEIQFGNLRLSQNEFEEKHYYKIKYRENLKPKKSKNYEDENEECDKLYYYSKWRDILSFLRYHFDSYQDVISQDYIGESPYYNGIFIYERSLEDDEINEIKELNVFEYVHLEHGSESPGFAIKFKKIIENINEINKVFVD